MRPIFKQIQTKHDYEIMASLNKAMIIGNLGQDPEVRYTQNNTAVATLNIATSERFKDSSGEWRERTEWHRVVAWGRLAEICDKYLKKGSQVYIEGPIQTNQWEDKNGQKRYTTEIKALTMTMLGSKGPSSGGGGDDSYNRGSGGSGVSTPSSGGNQSKPNQPVDFSGDDFDDDELPF